MATILQGILATIRGGTVVPTTHVNYGFTDGLEPPYICVTDYTHVTEYDTSGPAVREAKFRVLTIHKNVDDAEDLAEQVNALLECQTVTPQTMPLSCYQESYTVGQLEEKKYQWGVAIDYSLKADPTIAV